MSSVNINLHSSVKTKLANISSYCTIFHHLALTKIKCSPIHPSIHLTKVLFSFPLRSTPSHHIPNPYKNWNKILSTVVCKIGIITVISFNIKPWRTQPSPPPQFNYLGMQGEYSIWNVPTSFVLSVFLNIQKAMGVND